MRCFNVSIKNKKVQCIPETMHVPPHSHEDIAVCLVEAEWGNYNLDLSIDKDPANALEEQKLSPSVTVLHDDNLSPSKPKFTISLTPTSGGKALKLDPIVVNE